MIILFKIIVLFTIFIGLFVILHKLPPAHNIYNRMKTHAARAVEYNFGLFDQLALTRGNFFGIIIRHKKHSNIDLRDIAGHEHNKLNIYRDVCAKLASQAVARLIGSMQAAGTPPRAKTRSARKAKPRKALQSLRKRPCKH